MKLVCTILIILMSLVSAEEVKQYDGYKLVWNEEFNVDGKLNSEDWKFEEGFSRNYELQWYQADNAICKDGKLVIEGRKEKRPNPTYKPNGDWRQKRKFIEYTSASAITKKSWKYGRFEIRAKIKCEDGLWPAIWTVGVKGEWPSNGEIDILEFYKGKILANTVWGTKKRWNGNWDSVKRPLASFNDPDFDKKFHVWRMDWDPNSIKLYLDDELINSTELSRTINPTDRGPKNPFRQPHYILLNLALGSNAGPVDKTTFPSKYEIDYVRVYQHKVAPVEPVYVEVKPKQASTYNASMVNDDYKGKEIAGIHNLSEAGNFVNKKLGWGEDCDTGAYAWEANGGPSATLTADSNYKIEGKVSYRFNLRNGWSRWVMAMNDKKTLDFSKFKKLRFAVSSRHAANWDSFFILIEDEKGVFSKIQLKDLGFKADGKWHWCTIDMDALKKTGINTKKISKPFQIAWGGGVKRGHNFHLDHLHLVK